MYYIRFRNVCTYVILPQDNKRQSMYLAFYIVYLIAYIMWEESVLQEEKWRWFREELLIT
jgi:hypothetical protein